MSDEEEAKRRKCEEASGEEAVYRPVKLSRNDLYRPPTAEELNQLKEAESLFHCSLLKMQVRPLENNHSASGLRLSNVFILYYTDGRAAQRGGPG